MSSAIENNENDVEMENEEDGTRPRKKKLYTPEDSTPFQTVPFKRQRRNSKDQLTLKSSMAAVSRRKNSRDQKTGQVAPAQVAQQSRENSHEITLEVPKPVQPPQRLTRPKTRANYSEQNNFALEDVSEDQQLLEALRRSVKTHKKENPNNVSFDKSEQAEALSFPDLDKEQVLFAYTTDSRGDLIVRMEDFLCLSRNEYLSDVDIDFYIQYIYNEKLTEAQRQRTYIFGSHFYSLYATSSEFAGWKNEENAGLSAVEKRYNRVDGIVGDVNLFEKDFLIVPLMNNNHWFLAIVCYPGLDGIYTQDNIRMPDDELKRPTKTKNNEPLPSLKVPSIFVFDSITGNAGRKTTAINHIRNFLKSEYDNKYKDFMTRPFELVGHAPRVSAFYQLLPRVLLNSLLLFPSAHGN
jgi:Ulp1 family protease